MKKLSLFTLLFCSFFAFSQLGTSFPSKKIGGENSKWTFGGNAGLGGLLGNGGGGTSIFISPRVGYKVSENFETGLSTNINFNSSTYFSSTSIGIGPFANYYFNRNFFINGMLQEFFVNQKNKTTTQKLKLNETALYLGAGYLTKISEGTYMQIGGMYNVLYDKNKSVFGGAFIPNIGIVVGL